MVEIRSSRVLYIIPKPEHSTKLTILFDDVRHDNSYRPRLVCEKYIKYDMKDGPMLKEYAIKEMEDTEFFVWFNNEVDVDQHPFIQRIRPLCHVIHPWIAGLTSEFKIADPENVPNFMRAWGLGDLYG